MLPISDAHFAFCGIATIAATLGYACARRAVLSLAASNESSANVEAGPPKQRSLKRKLDDSDEPDPDTEEQSRPMKRNKTPPVDQDGSDEDFYQEWEVIVAPPSYEQAIGLRQPEQPPQDQTTPPKEDSLTIEQHAITPVREPTPPAVPETSPQPEAERCATPPPPQVIPSPNEPEIPPTHPMTPPKPTIPAKVEPLNAFSAFSGPDSPFTSYSNASGTSPLSLSGQTVRDRTAPAWRHDNESETDVFGCASSADALLPSPNDTVPPTRTKCSPFSHRTSTLVAHSKTQFVAKPSSCLTGEEDETVEVELKGVKLFVKRGRKEFSDGIYGHVKILTQKPTSQDPRNEEAEAHSRTRLLFRRDPLGQVSMNVGLCPAVRCHFDAAENILRIILVEQAMADGKDSKEDIVIYALKPGRAQKADFQSFAKALCGHEGLKSESPTMPASGVAAAS